MATFDEILSAIEPESAARYRALPQLQGLTDINAFGPNTGTLGGKRVNYFVMGTKPGEYRVENGLTVSNSTQRDTNYLQPEAIADGQFFITSEGNAPRMEAPAADDNMLTEAWKAYGPILVAAAMGSYAGGAWGGAEAAAASTAPGVTAESLAASSEAAWATVAPTGGTTLAGVPSWMNSTYADTAEAALTGVSAGETTTAGTLAMGQASLDARDALSAAGAANSATQAPKSPDGAKSAIDYAKEYAPLISSAATLGGLGFAVTQTQAAKTPDSPSVPPLMAPPTSAGSQASKTPSPNVFKKKMASLGDTTMLTGAGGVPNSSLTLGRATVLGS